MNKHTPKAEVKAVHCKRLALRAAVIAVVKKIAQEQQKAKEQK